MTPEDFLRSISPGEKQPDHLGLDQFIQVINISFYINLSRYLSIYRLDQRVQEIYLLYRLLRQEQYLLSIYFQVVIESRRQIPSTDCRQEQYILSIYLYSLGRIREYRRYISSTDCRQEQYILSTRIRRTNLLLRLYFPSHSPLNLSQVIYLEFMEILPQILTYNP